MNSCRHGFTFEIYNIFVIVCQCVHFSVQCSEIVGILSEKVDFILINNDNAGYSRCECGWTSNGRAVYPMTYSADGCGNAVRILQIVILL